MVIYFSFFILTERQKKRPSFVNPNLHLVSEMKTKTNTFGLFISCWCIAWEERNILVPSRGYEIYPFIPPRKTTQKSFW